MDAWRENSALELRAGRRRGQGTGRRSGCLQELFMAQSTILGQLEDFTGGLLTSCRVRQKSGLLSTSE